MDIVVAIVFAGILVAGARQLARERRELPVAVDAPSQARIARWQSQRDLLVLGAALLIAGLGLTRLGGAIEAAIPWLTTVRRIVIFLGVGAVGLVLTLLRSGGRPSTRPERRT